MDSRYIQSKSDYSLFTKITVVGLTCILVYVDDLVLAGDDIEEIQSIKRHLDSLFSIKDLGVLKFFWVLKWLVPRRVSHFIKENMPYIYSRMQACWLQNPAALLWTIT